MIPRPSLKETARNHERLVACPAPAHAFVPELDTGNAAGYGAVCVYCGGHVSRRAATLYVIGLMHGAKMERRRGGR